MPQLETVYFDFERWELRDDARSALQENALALKESAQWTRLTIEGHCDERGSEEYNMALGERRAGVVQRYLKDLGVPATRLKTVSFGESQPAVAGHDESSWQQNRRAELKLETHQASR
jgi:peptidoglycan-associated lipoprotein